MYETPTLERFGTFRELTRVGFNATSDGCTIIGIDGNTADGNELAEDGSGTPPGFCVPVS